MTVGTERSLLARLTELHEKTTPGPWQEDGLLWVDGKPDEADVSANDGEDWITFKSRRAEADRALWIAAVDAPGRLVTPPRKPVVPPRPQKLTCSECGETLRSGRLGGRCGFCVAGIPPDGSSA